MIKWFLVVLVLNGTGSGWRLNYLPMENEQTCSKAVKEAKTDIAKGGDAEQGVAIFCAQGKAE